MVLLVLMENQTKKNMESKWKLEFYGGVGVSLSPVVSGDGFQP